MFVHYVFPSTIEGVPGQDWLSRYSQRRIQIQEWTCDFWVLLALEHLIQKKELQSRSLKEQNWCIRLLHKIWSPGKQVQICWVHDCHRLHNFRNELFFNLSWCFWRNNLLVIKEISEEIYSVSWLYWMIVALASLHSIFVLKLMSTLKDFQRCCKICPNIKISLFKKKKKIQEKYKTSVTWMSLPKAEALGRSDHCKTSLWSIENALGHKWSRKWTQYE